MKNEHDLDMDSKFNSSWKAYVNSVAASDVRKLMENIIGHPVATRKLYVTYLLEHVQRIFLETKEELITCKLLGENIDEKPPY